MYNPEADKQYKELMSGIFDEYRVRGKANTAVLVPEIKACLKNIKNIRNAAKQKELDGENLTAPYEWIADNFRYIEDRTKSCISALKSFGEVSGAVNISDNYGKRLPLYYCLFYSYIKSLSSSINEKSLSGFTACCDKKISPSPEFSDFYSFELLFSCGVIKYISELCTDISDGEADGEKTAGELGKCVGSLRFLSGYSFEGCFEYCEAERFLRLDPSGYYSVMSKETKDIYRNRVSVLAKKNKVSEAAFVKDILEKARASEDEKARHIGSYIYPAVSQKTKNAYIISLAGAVCILTVLLCFVTPLGLVFLFPIWEAAKQITDKIFASFVKTYPLPRLDLDEIPDTCGVLVVITTLLLGEKHDSKIFKGLENIYHSCGKKNVHFAVLGDFPDSSSPCDDSDGKTLDFAKARISALNSKYGNSFYLFIRNRRYSEKQNKYMGYERKRGAVASLCSFLCGKSEPDFIKTSESMPDSLCDSIHYVITLDADTNLSHSSIKEMVCTMLHPLNTPVIDKKRGIVVSGYGIMQPKVTAELKSARATPFANTMCGTGGIEIYSFAGFDLYQSVFGEAVFCGKGIFDKYAFNEVINSNKTAFPDNKILSHDILEGARLRCGLINDLEVTDSFPSNLFSYLKRHHRWVRGDVQNLAFLFGSFVNSAGQTVKNEISTLSKFKLFDNIRRELSPVISFFGIIISGFLPEKAAAFFLLASVFCYIFPFISDLCGMICTLSFECAARRFFAAGVTSGIWQSFLRMLLYISALPCNAVTTLGAVCVSLYRMLFSGKNMLEWVTAAQSDASSDNGYLAYIQKNLIGAVTGVFLLIFSPYGLIKLIGFMWFLFPRVAYNSSKNINNKSLKATPAQKETLSSYARDIWKFFEDTVTEKDSFLPPDNLQLFPEEKIAHKTSPTNIGLYLICILSARDFGFISSKKMCELLDKTLGSVEKAEKLHGHLYNWYDTTNLSILEPKYISSVDSGNLLACYIALAEGLKEYVSEEPKLLDIIVRTEKLFSDTKLAPLYDEKKELFILGLSKDNKDVNRYDMLMSEVRTLSYIAVATGAVPKKHWSRLSRPLVSISRHIGVASWNGTAFEYFMPALFMPAEKGSLMYEALKFAFFRQINRQAVCGGKRIWGISESGYCTMDAENNYGYKAFGIPELGYKRGLEKELVISPYSSFLSLCINKKLSLENLNKIKNCGFYGEYGFFEAIDFTKERTDGRAVPVKSHMSHHFGMSFIACANACFDDIFVKRFMGNPIMRSAGELLEEKIPVNAVVNNNII